MSYKISTLLFLAGLLVAGRAVAADDTNAPPATDYPSFQVIASHNIFNPGRTGARPSTTRTYTRTPRTDYFTLRGTMAYAKGQFAFFDGSSSAYHKTLNVGQTIAGYKITEITADNIKLAATSNQVFNLPVGTQMRRPEGGLWTLAGRAEPSPDTGMPAPDISASAAGTNAVPGAPAAPTAPSALLESDAAKRLMLKRLNEQ